MAHRVKNLNVMSENRDKVYDPDPGNGLKQSLQKREKGTFFAVGSDVLISAKKEPSK